MSRYVDAFVIPLPARNLAAYRRIARQACKVWLEHGALDYVESVGDDLKVGMGLTFPKGTKLRRGDAVLFSWILYKSRAHRDRVNARVMKDPRMLAMCKPNEMPFELKRMMFGGFKVIVSA